uniref:(California timema) hypothetical protein n=1 Tax=Timema californicum TaxID=61474 RepID=A0A7R9J2K4_TIMCA|nr:unnamed protein product [Timema californicum]
MSNGSLPFNKFDFVVGWLFRECSSLYLFLVALWNPSIRWRARTYKLRWGGVAEEMKPKKATVYSVSTFSNNLLYNKISTLRIV